MLPLQQNLSVLQKHRVCKNILVWSSKRPYWRAEYPICIGGDYIINPCSPAVQLGLCIVMSGIVKQVLCGTSRWLYLDSRDRVVFANKDAGVSRNVTYHHFSTWFIVRLCVNVVRCSHSENIELIYQNLFNSSVIKLPLLDIVRVPWVTMCDFHTCAQVLSTKPWGHPFTSASHIIVLGHGHHFMRIFNL